MLHSAAIVMDALRALWDQTAPGVAALLLGPGSTYSLVALTVTLSVAAAWTIARARPGRALRPRVLARALFPPRILRSASGRADLALTAFNIMLAPLLLGGAILAAGGIAASVQGALAQLAGTPALLALPWIAAAPLVTLALFLAYEFAYWLDHYLSHRSALLWQFHQVHHSADSLSLLTAFRVHPVDSLVFYNIVAMVMGVAGGLVGFALGPAAGPLTVGGNNVLVFAGAVLLTHLHHSHLWIILRGRAGRLLLSPAHHQIHHSSDPAHHDRNFGNCIAVWDRLFGTHYQPAARREPLVFGVHGAAGSPHSVTGTLLAPFAGAARLLARKPRGAAPSPGRA